MRIAQTRWIDGEGWQPVGGTAPEEPVRASFILVFGGAEALSRAAWRGALVDAHPDAHILGCSTAGEILGDAVFDDSLHATLVELEKTQCELASITVSDSEDSEQAGRRLVNSLPEGPLAHVFVLSDGQHVNGSALVRGMVAALPDGVAVTGGLAGDGARFQRTLVVADGEPRERIVAAIGLYGHDLRVGYGSMGGWDPFGPEREVTAVEGNVLSELDGQPALELYKKYLGEHAAGLPATGLLFPLSIRTPDGHSFVRTILAVDSVKQTVTFAGDIPHGSYARLMKANFDRLVDGAHGAAERSRDPLGESQPGLAILISCVGRKLVLQQRTEEEVEAVRGVLGRGTPVTGFYSYGEICPSAPAANCDLHNQTMTITTLTEL